MFEIKELELIRIIEMDHGKVNAIDIEFCQDLISILHQLTQDSGCRAAILTSGGRVFSAGVDLIRFLREDRQYIQHFLDALQECFRLLFRFPKPIVAGINGHAIAGGCILASACDRRVIADCAKIGVAELRVGVPFPPIALEIMRFAASPPALQPMISIGATFRGQDAIEAGLADAIESLEKTKDLAIEVTGQLLAIPTDVFTLTKRQLRLPALENAQQADRRFGDQIRSLWESDQTRELIQDFVNRRLSEKLPPQREN